MIMKFSERGIGFDGMGVWTLGRIVIIFSFDNGNAKHSKNKSNEIWRYLTRSRKKNKSNIERENSGI